MRRPWSLVLLAAVLVLALTLAACGTFDRGSVEPARSTAPVRAVVFRDPAAARPAVPSTLQAQLDALIGRVGGLLQPRALLRDDTQLLQCFREGARSRCVPVCQRLIARGRAVPLPPGRGGCSSPRTPRARLIPARR